MLVSRERAQDAVKCDAKVVQWHGKTHSVFIETANNRTFRLFIADTLCVSTGEEINMCRSLRGSVGLVTQRM